MAALGNIPKLMSHSIPKYSSNIISSSSSSSILISSRGIVTKLFIGGLSFFTTENVLLETFSRYGQVIEAKVVTDRVTQKSKGFGFVTYASEDEAEKATREMNGNQLNGRIISVDYANSHTNFGSAGPIARGPPESAKASNPVLASMEQETS